MQLDEALRARISVRAYTDQPVPEQLVRDILDVARWAPSGGNVQPWKVIAVAGAERDAVIALAKEYARPREEKNQFPPYPAPLWEPYRTRRFSNGEDLYASVEIPRDNKLGRLMQFARNFEFFGAPVGLFFIMDRRMGHTQWSHLGMFMQSIALAAVERGLSTCMQEAWGMVREPLAQHFALPPEEMIINGMALGYADAGAPINAMRRERAPVDEIATFKGF
ncbi:MAG: nitroreductase [Hyphomonadaceae bacterium]|nr:nitroreductase [Hyphomonadaceae bacterium]